MTWLSANPVHSAVEFAIRHLMISTVKGRFVGLQGTVSVDQAEPELERRPATPEVLVPALGAR